MEALRVFVGLFSSRKNQIMAGGYISIILAAIGFRDYPPEVVAVIIGAIAGLAMMVINGIKAEDVAAKTAAGMVAAANVTAQTTAKTTTLTTPSENVNVSTSETPAPAPPPVPVQPQSFMGRH